MPYQATTARPSAYWSQGAFIPQGLMIGARTTTGQPFKSFKPPPKISFFKKHRVNLLMAFAATAGLGVLYIATKKRRR